MEVRSKTPVLSLAAGDVVTLDDARGTRIQLRSGTLWVTEEANPEDRVIGPGETLIVSRDGRTVIQALQQAWVAIAQPAAAANDPVHLVQA